MKVIMTTDIVSELGPKGFVFFVSSGDEIFSVLNLLYSEDAECRIHRGMGAIRNEGLDASITPYQKVDELPPKAVMQEAARENHSRSLSCKGMASLLLLHPEGMEYCAETDVHRVEVVSPDDLPGSILTKIELTRQQILAMPYHDPNGRVMRSLREQGYGPLEWFLGPDMRPEPHRSRIYQQLLSEAFQELN